MSEPAKTITIKMRVDPTEKRALDWAARQASLPLSVWLRRLALAEARGSAQKARGAASK